MHLTKTKIDIVNVFSKDDEDMGGDATFTHLFIDGEYQFRGDYYHDRIDTYIEGFLDGMKHLQPEIQLEENSHDIRVKDDFIEATKLESLLKKNLNKKEKKQ